MSSLWCYPCSVSSHTCSPANSYAMAIKIQKEAAWGGGKRYHTRMVPNLASVASCQQHSGCQSGVSRNKEQWKYKPEVFSFLQISFLEKQKVKNFNSMWNEYFVSLPCFELEAVNVFCKKEEEEEICVRLGCQSTFKISRVLLFTFSSYSIRSHKILFT